MGLALGLTLALAAVGPATRAADAPVAAGGAGIRWVRIPAGTFTMGCNEGDGECSADESPAHQVTISGPFALAETETTVGQYRSFATATGRGMLAAPEFSQTDDHPAVSVDWDDAKAFCEWAGGRLPTEAEWEYAARGGLSGAKYPWGDSISHENANYFGSGGPDAWEGTSPVRSFAANGFGLYDMAGNAYEWVADWRGESYYADSPERDPIGPSSGTLRVLRGGSWDHGPRNLRVSDHVRHSPAVRSARIGFRCARAVSPRALDP